MNRATVRDENVVIYEIKDLYPCINAHNNIWVRVMVRMN